MAAHGITYLRQRRSPRPKGAVTPEDLAEGILATKLERPEWARFRKADHFGALYERIFSEDLDPGELVSIVSTVAMFVHGWQPKAMPKWSRMLSYSRHFLMWRVADLLRAQGQWPVAAPDAEELAQCLALAARELMVLGPLLLRDEHASLQRQSALFRRGDEVRRAWRSLRERVEAALAAHAESSERWLQAVQSDDVRVRSLLADLSPAPDWVLSLAFHAKQLYPDLDLGAVGRVREYLKGRSTAADAGEVPDGSD